INFGSNDWTTSQLNTINLNTNYWNYLGEYWQNKIIETTWHLGALEEINQDELKNLINKVKTAYKEERENIGFGNNPTEYSDEIGLIYISDFGYATSPEAWTIMIG